MAAVHNRLEEIPVSILTFIWQERIYCSACYIFESNPDGIQLFKWVQIYIESAVHEDEKCLGIG
jgi:hypothetical protein